MAITLDGSNGITTDIASNESATFNRDTTDGDLIILQKDGSTVGSIRSDSTGRTVYNSANNAGYLGVNDTRRYYWTGTDLSPMTDGGPDLGASSFRFKDLYLSGGVYLGGTGAANKLDDYEEGTWSPSIQSGGWTISSTTGAKYTKVGNLVFYSFHIEASGSGNSSQLVVGGLPFTVLSNGYAVMPVDFAYGGIKGTYARVVDQGTNIDFFYLSESTGTLRQGLLGNQIGAGYIIVSGCYNTSQ